MDKINIQEIIPLTIQGEGVQSGMPCSFIRLFGCPVGCYFCDTGYATDIDSPSFKKMTIDDAIKSLESKSVVITGGEPTVNPAFPSLVHRLIDNDYQVSVETAGIRWVDELRDCWVTFSPKAHVSSYPADYSFWQKSSEIKVVIGEPGDFYFYEEMLCNAIAEKIPVLLQAEWSQKDLIRDFIIEKANAIGARVSVQSHKYLGVR
jgi:organic radical activating enzyme